MDVSDAIALFALIVSGIAVFVAGQSQKEAHLANQIAEANRKEAIQANVLAQSSNLYSRHANILADQANQQSEQANETASRSLSFAEDVAKKQSRARPELNFTDTMFGLGRHHIANVQIRNDGMVAASSLFLHWQTDNVDEAYVQCDPPLRLEPGEGFQIRIDIVPSEVQPPVTPFTLVPVFQLLLGYTDLYGRHVIVFHISYENWWPTTAAIVEDGQSRYPDPILPVLEEI